MRILIVTHHTIPHLGGIEVLSYGQSKGLAEKGHTVSIISSRTNSEISRELRDGVKIVRFDAWNILEEQFGVPYPFYSPLLISGLSKALQITDVCIIHSIGFMSSFIAALLCKLYKVPYVLIQNNQFVRYQSLCLNLLERMNDHLFGKFVVANATEIFSVSAGTKRYIEIISGRQSNILRNFADPGFYRDLGSKQGLRKRLGLPVERFLVLTCGRLIENKSFDTLLKTACVLQNSPEFFFIIIGDGPKRPALEKYIQEHKLNNSLLTGTIPHEIISEYFHACDVFVLPSKGGEGFPIVILEAMASALPVITTRVADQEGIFIHRKNGFLVNLNAPEQIADILREYIEKPRELSEISEEGRDIVSRDYSLETHTRILEAALSIAVKVKERRVN